MLNLNSDSDGRHVIIKELWNDNEMGLTELFEESMSQYEFVALNPTWTGLGSNPVLRRDKATTMHFP